jgi:acetyltransferase-like isoleucine patch superfamily enzyme
MDTLAARGRRAAAGPAHLLTNQLAETAMNNFLSGYFRVFDTGIYLAQTARGRLRTLCTPAAFGPLPNVRGRVKFHIRGEAVFGEHFTALGDGTAVLITVQQGARLTVGDYVAINSGVSIEAWHDVRIGSLVMIAPNASIIDDNRHELEPGTPLYKGPTVIEDNVWLATNVSVLPGVTIGAGSVVAANSVVSRDIPPNSLAGGSPARVLKTLSVPEGWSHRFGYQQNQPSPGLLAGLRRTLAGDPNAAIAASDVAEQDPQPATPDHEAVS